MPLKKPRKRFSQNFLIDKDIAARIVRLLEVEKNDTVFEIGSGRGILTRIVANTGAKTFAFEIDSDLVSQLTAEYEKYDNVEIVNIDFLKVQPSIYHRGRFKLIGNIPFDITSPLIEWIIRYRQSISWAVITMQRELADRICSGPGSKNWAPISIFTQCFFDVRNAMTIPPTVFYPKPKVFSSTLVFRPEERYKIDNWRHFEEIVRMAFVHRRKLLTNNLSKLLGLGKDGAENILSQIGLPKNARAEQLGIEDLIRLSNEIESLNIS